MVFTTAVMGTFGVLRVIAETALYAWSYEFVPRRVRAQFSAVNNIVSPCFGLGERIKSPHRATWECTRCQVQAIDFEAASVAEHDWRLFGYMDIFFCCSFCDVHGCV